MIDFLGLGLARLLSAFCEMIRGDLRDLHMTDDILREEETANSSSLEERRTASMQRMMSRTSNILAARKHCNNLGTVIKISHVNIGTRFGLCSLLINESRAQSARTRRVPQVQHLVV